VGQIRQLRDLRGAPLRTIRRPRTVASAVRPTPEPAVADLEPIEGVSLAHYAEISKCLAAVGYDQTQAPAIAAAKGVAPGAWERATAGWTARIRADPSVARLFNQLYANA
jgi:hypothetical protein